MMKKVIVGSFQDDKKKIKTESGVWIPASYKSDRYKKWKQRSRVAQLQEQQTHGEGNEQREGMILCCYIMYGSVGPNV